MTAQRLLVLVLLAASGWWGTLVSAQSSTTEPGDEPLEATSAADAAPAEGVADEGSEDEPKEKQPTGRLLIVTDADATILIDGVSLGVLLAGATLEHEVTDDEGNLKAIAQEAAAAVLTRSWEFERPDDDSADAEREATELPIVEIRLRMAKAIRNLRRTERQQKIYPDFKGGVMWAREDNRAHVTWSKAAEFCDDSDLGGWRDWRLPDIEELSELQAMWSQAQFKTLDPIRLTECCPWSSSEIDETRAWNFNFRFRRKFDGFKGHSFGMRALCIRDLTAEEIAEHEEALADRERKKKEEKKRRKAIKKGLIEEDAENTDGDPEEPNEALPKPPPG